MEHGTLPIPTELSDSSPAQSLLPLPPSSSSCPRSAPGLSFLVSKAGSLFPCWTSSEGWPGDRRLARRQWKAVSPFSRQPKGGAGAPAPSLPPYTPIPAAPPRGRLRPAPGPSRPADRNALARPSRNQLSTAGPSSRRRQRRSRR